MNKIKKIVNLDDVPMMMNADTLGNPKDEGRWKSLIDREKGSKDLSLGIGWLKPGEVHLRHHHEDVSEFYYVLEGAGKVTVGDEVANVTAGTAIYIPAGDTHGIINDGEKEMVVLFGYDKLEWESIWDE